MIQTNKIKSLKINFIMNSILTMSNIVFPLITFPYVSRILLPDGMGRVSFATSFISYFSMFAQLGIPTYGIRVCAKVRDNQEELTRTAQELLVINIIFSFLSYIGLFSILLIVPRFYEDRQLYFIMSVSILLTSIGMEWLYKALEQYTYITARSIIFKFIALIMMFLMIHEKNDYVVYGAISVFASSASNILNFIYIHKYIGFKPIGNYNFLRHIKPIFIFFAMSCATTIYTNLDTVMLGFMKTTQDVGYYNAAVKIKSVLASFVSSLGTVLLPRSSYNVEHGLMKTFWETSKKSMNFVIIVSLPLLLYFMLFAEEAIYFLSGSAYAGSIIPMQIIMPTLLFIGLSNLLGIQMLIPLGKEKIVLFSEIIGAVVDVIINALLIPWYASAGAAVGTLMAEFIVLLIQYVSLKNDIAKVLKSIRYSRILFALLFGCIASVWVKELSLGGFLTLILSAVLFFAIYTLFLFLSKEPLIVEVIKLIKAKVKKRLF